MNRIKPSTGFTLVEMVMVIVITGIIAGMVAVFLKTPVEGYFSTVQRAALTEEADSALRFVARDLQSALPNSIACTGSGLRFLAVRSGGRFREGQTGTGSGTPLPFGEAITSFDMIGASAVSATTDALGNSVSNPLNLVVVGNLGQGVSSCHNDSPPFAANAAAISSISTSSVAIASNSFPAACNLTSALVQDDATTIGANESNNREFGRFYVVDSSPVIYVCDTIAGLTRNTVPLADQSHVSACQMVCDESKARVQMISFNLTLRDRDNEPVNMLRRITIVNRP